MALVQSPQESVSPVGTIVVWSLQIGLGIVYLMAGFGKLTGHPAMVALFNAIGAGQWLRFAIGATETTGALLLFIPRYSGLAALALCPVMVGAIATGFVVRDLPPAATAAAVGCLLGLAVLAWLRRVDTIQVVRGAIR